MFVKTNTGNPWINLGTCRSVETYQSYPNDPWRIMLRSAIVSSSEESVFFVGNFVTEEEAESAINVTWEAYKEGEKVWEVESFDTISCDSPSTAERFNELISQAEYRDCYESRNQTEKLCEFGADLMALVENEQWELTHKFKKHYFALYFGHRRVFGVSLRSRPKLAV